MSDAVVVDAHPFEARPHRTLALLTVPVMLSLIAEPLAGLVDTAFVERLGVESAAALGAATALLSSVVWVFNFLGIGTQTEVAHFAGEGGKHGTSDGAEGRPSEARRVASMALLVAAGLGALAAAFAGLAVGPASEWMSGDPGVRAETETYLAVRLLGLPAMLVQFAAFGALRGLQDMRTPLWIAAGMSAANIALDAVLIFGWGPVPALGIVGAAWATVASQVVAAGFAILAVVSRLGFTWHFELARARALLVVGRDMVVRTSALLLFLLLATRVALEMGPAAGAANQAMRQVWMLLAFLLDAFAASAQSLVGYFLGSGRVALARRVASVSLIWGVATGALLAALLLVAAPLVAGLLVPPEARALFAAAWPVFALAQPLNAISFVTDGIHWGAKDYPYLRNGMLVSGVVGVVVLLRLDTAGADGLRLVWWTTALWVSIRAAFGLARIWPAVGRAPLARASIPE